MNWMPDTCPVGHPLPPGKAKVSWAPCTCAKASGSPRGHQYVMCLTCHREQRKDGCDNLVDGYEVAGPDTSGVAL